MKIRIATLYGRLMNIYGDHGNLLCLVKRCEWRGIAVEVVEIGAGDRLEPGDFEILLLGGGQERQQAAAGADLATGKGDVIVISRLKQDIYLDLDKDVGCIKTRIIHRLRK